MKTSMRSAEMTCFTDQLHEVGASIIKQHLPYIDCLRGYAILLVISCHLAYVFPALPYPVHRLVVSGWFGVQLFFLASCITLLKSWHSELSKTGTVSISAFFIRRFFRIAPAYYAAALLYGYFGASPGGFDLWNVVITFAFMNGLHPIWSAGPNSIVPGGWSIGVEFAFYAIFPLFAYSVTSLPRAVTAFIISVFFGLVSNFIVLRLLSPSLPSDIVLNGLFFWFPNQFSVFALGAVVYFIIQDSNSVLTRFVAKFRTIFPFLLIFVFCALSFIPLGKYLGESLSVPASLAISIVFGFGIITLASGPCVFVNRIVANMGKVSFSAYLIHFFVLDVARFFPNLFHTNAIGYSAVLAYLVSWPVVVIVTYALSWLSFQYLETPAIALGKIIIQSRSGIQRPSALN